MNTGYMNYPFTSIHDEIDFARRNGILDVQRQEYTYPPSFNSYTADIKHFEKRTKIVVSFTEDGLTNLMQVNNRMTEILDLADRNSAVAAALAHLETTIAMVRKHYV
jgi:hypothetical protein